MSQIKTSATRVKQMHSEHNWRMQKKRKEGSEEEGNKNYVLWIYPAQPSHSSAGCRRRRSWTGCVWVSRFMFWKQKTNFRWQAGDQNAAAIEAGRRKCQVIGSMIWLDANKFSNRYAILNSSQPSSTSGCTFLLMAFDSLLEKSEWEINKLECGSIGGGRAVGCLRWLVEGLNGKKKWNNLSIYYPGE